MEIISLFNMLKLHQSVNDDILLEIFIRLRDRRSLIRCSAVCKHWFSIINSSHYDHRLQSQSQSESQCDPFTIIFRHGLLYQITKPVYEYFPKEYSEQQISSASSNGGGSCLGFLPWPDLRIHSSVDDLLLISRENCQYFIICNPFTRQWIELPQIPLDPESFWCTFFVYAGLVLESNNRKQKQHQYKVMIIWYANHDLHRITFSSETGKWNRIFNSLTIPNGLSFHPPIVCNGLLHWYSMDQYNPTVDGISAFDPFKEPDHPKYFRFIKFPLDLDRVATWKSRLTRIRLGLVQDRLRLSQLLVTKRDGFVLKVWELSEDDDDDDDHGIWTLVHDVTVKRWTENRHYFVVAFHPNNGNVLFLLHKQRFIYQFDIGNEKMRKVAQLPNGGDESFPLYLGSYVVMHHPLWPTPISALSYL